MVLALLFDNLGRSERLRRTVLQRVVEAKAKQQTVHMTMELGLSCRTSPCEGSGAADGDDLRLYGQANKRTRWMPWRSEAMKDVAACEKYGGAGNKH